MGKYDTWSITCNLCDWQWETCSRVMAQKPKCKVCGSDNCSVEKINIQTIKKQGKIITEIGFDPKQEIIGEINEDTWENTSSFNKPLIVIREEDCKFSDRLTDDERKDLLGKMDLIRSKILRDIRNSGDEQNTS